MKENKCIEMAKSANGNNVSTKMYLVTAVKMSQTHDIDEANI